MTRVIFTALFISTTVLLHAQSSEVHVNESFRNTPLNKVLKVIQKNYKIKFGYDNNLVKPVIVTIELKELTIPQSMKRLLQGTELTYEHIGDNYVIIPRPVETKKSIERTNITLSGKVIDADNGETLPQTTIRVSGTNIATASNNDGYFTLLNIPNDTCTVEIMYIGYITHRIAVSSIDRPEQLVIRLRSDARLLNEVVVLGEYNHAIHVEDLPGSFVFNPKSVSGLPSLGEQDMSRTLQLLPGVSATDESASGMAIRGSHSGYNLTLLDGITIYQQDHFFGAFSIINADIIKDVHVSKGMFDSRYGGRASGVIDITTKNGNAIRPSFNVKLNMMNLKGSAEIPLGKKWSLLAAARRSFTDKVQSKLFSNLFDIASVSNDQIRFLSYEMAPDHPSYHFADGNSKLTFRPSERDVISLSYYLSRDKMHNYDSLSFDDGSVKYVDHREETTRWGNNGVSLRWGRQWTKGFYSNSRLSHSKFYRAYDVDTDTELNDGTDSSVVQYGIDVNNYVNDFSYAINNEWSLRENLSLDFGIEGVRQQMYGRAVISLKASGTIPPDDEMEDIDNIISSQSWLNSFYASATSSPIKRLSTTFGARAVYYYNKEGRFYFEPRFSARYELWENINIKGAYGRGNQFISQQLYYTRKGAISGSSENDWMLADPGDVRYPVISSDHVTAGTTIRKQQFVLDAEVFYKFTKGVIIDEDFNSASTVSYGMDLMVQKISGIHTGWIAYSLGQHTQTHPYIFNGQSAPSWQDQRHELKIINMLNLGRWNVASTLVYGSGRPYAKYIVRYERNQDGDITGVEPVLDYSNSSRLPSYFSLNLSITYKMVFTENHNLELGLSIHNITGHKNIKTRRIDEARLDEAILTNTEVQPVYNDINLLGFTPSLFLSFSF